MVDDAASLPPIPTPDGREQQRFVKQIQLANPVIGPVLQ